MPRPATVTCDSEYVTTIDERDELALLERLVSPYGPIAAASPMKTPAGIGPDRLTITSAAIGSGAPGAALRASGVKSVIAAGGKGVDNEHLARLVAIAEGADALRHGLPGRGEDPGPGR